MVFNIHMNKSIKYILTLVDILRNTLIDFPSESYVKLGPALD